MLYFLTSVLVLIVVNILDGSISTLFASVFIYIFGYLYSLNVGVNFKWNSVKLFFSVFSVYLLSAYIFSLSFQDNNFFLVSDPIAYYNREFSNTSNHNLNFYLNYLYRCYFEFADNNALYNSYLKLLSTFANKFLGGGSLLYATLAQTVFGILSSTVLYRIFTKYYSANKAYKYTLAFSLLSLFHFYSSVIIRDIIVAYFYLLGFEILLNKYSNRNLIKLVLYLFIIWGIRLYSGLYFFVFIFYFLYIHLRKTRYSTVVIPVFLILSISIAYSSNFILKQSIDELMLYQEFSIERGEVAGGLSSHLMKLPVGIKQIVLTLYSQFHPFPPYAPMLHVSTLSQFYMSILVFLYSVWWAFVFFSLIIYFSFKRNLIKLTFDNRLLFLISILFIMINTAQPDIRRMMPVYPYLYLLYTNVRNQNISSSFRNNINVILALTFTFAWVLYLYLT